LKVNTKLLSASGEQQIRDAIKKEFACEITRRTQTPHEYEYRFAADAGRRWRSDIAFPDVRVAIEIDGGIWVYGRHNRAASMLSDLEKGNAYAARGWVVFHVPWEWIDGGKRDRYLSLVIDISNVIRERQK
jgi:hypothetical protein